MKPINKTRMQPNASHTVTAPSHPVIADPNWRSFPQAQRQCIEN